MKTLIPVLILTLILAGSSRAQTRSTLISSPPELTPEQLTPLFAALERNDWTTSYKISLEYLELLKNDERVRSIGNLRYMLLLSAAGSISSGSMTYDDLDKMLPKVIGKQITTPFFFIQSDCARQSVFNFICPGTPDYNLTIISKGNERDLAILASQYYKLAKPFDLKLNMGKPAALTGILDKIDRNTVRSKFEISRWYVIDTRVMMQSDLEKPEIMTSH